MELILSKLQSESGCHHLAGEEWRAVPGFGDFYEASSLGRIRSKARVVEKRHKSGAMIKQQYGAKILSPSADRDGYLSVSVGIDRKTFKVRIHHFVLMAWVGPRPDGLIGCHNNGRPSDNRPENLRWDDHLGNMRDRKMHGNCAFGASHPMTTISEDTATIIAADPRNAHIISEEMGVSRRVVQRIKSGESWGHLTGVVPSPGKTERRFVRGDAHASAKLDENNIRAIRSDGRPQRDIAADYGIGQATIWAIKNRKTWAHVE